MSNSHHPIDWFMLTGAKPAPGWVYRYDPGVTIGTLTYGQYAYLGLAPPGTAEGDSGWYLIRGERHADILTAGGMASLPDIVTEQLRLDPADAENWTDRASHAGWHE